MPVKMNRILFFSRNRVGHCNTQLIFHHITYQWWNIFVLRTSDFLKVIDLFCYRTLSWAKLVWLLDQCLHILYKCVLRHSGVWIIRIDIYSAIVTFTPVYFHMLYVVHYFIGIYIWFYMLSNIECQSFVYTLCDRQWIENICVSYLLTSGNC